MTQDERNARRRQQHAENREQNNARRREMRRAQPEEVKARERVYNKMWYEAHRDSPETRTRTRVAGRKWRAKHRDLANYRCSLWYEQNSEKSLEAQRKRRLDNPRMSAYYASNRRAKSKGAAGSHTMAQWLDRVDYHAWRCVYCRCELTSGTLTKDHVIPIARGGSHWPANLAPACLKCNSVKQHKTVKEFRIYLRKREAMACQTDFDFIISRHFNLVPFKAE